MAEIALGRELSDDDVEKYKDQARDLSVEEVQRIKELVSKVGSLEFRILANQNDDAKGIEDARKVFQEAGRTRVRRVKSTKAAQVGLPPPDAIAETGKPKRLCKIATPRHPLVSSPIAGSSSGPQERPGSSISITPPVPTPRTTAWYLARTPSATRKLSSSPKSIRQHDRAAQPQGALFYSHE